MRSWIWDCLVRSPKPKPIGRPRYLEVPTETLYPVPGRVDPKDDSSRRREEVRSNRLYGETPGQGLRSSSKTSRPPRVPFDWWWGPIDSGCKKKREE